MHVMKTDLPTEEERPIADQPIEEELPPEAAEETPAEEIPATPAAEEDPALDEAVIDRLADEFLALAEEMTDVALPEDLPDEVWQTAAAGVPLRDACLRYWFAEQNRCQAAQKAAAHASAGSAGSLRDVPDDPRPEESVFAHSFRTALN